MSVCSKEQVHDDWESRQGQIDKTNFLELVLLSNLVLACLGSLSGQLFGSELTGLV